MDSKELRWGIAGFFGLTFGNAFGAVHMFRGDLLATMGGVGLMFVGFQAIHYGFHGEWIVNRVPNRSTGAGSDRPVYGWILTLALLLVSVYCIAQGFVIGAQAAVQSFTLVDMGVTGGFVVGGYITGHVAVHGVPL